MIFVQFYTVCVHKFVHTQKFVHAQKFVHVLHSSSSVVIYISIARMAWLVRRFVGHGGPVMSGSWAPTDLAVGMHAPPHMVTVAIPAGVGPGQSFQLQTADGGSFQVTVPPGLGPGQSLTVQMPAAPPAGLLPPQASAPAAFAHVAPGGQRESFQPADNARIEAARRSGMCR